VTEADAVARAQSPATVESLTADLRALGVAPGVTLVVHSSLSSLGWVCGGAQTVVMALQRAVADTGTLVLPAFSSDNSEPSLWRNPPVPQAWHQVIRDHMPAYDPRVSPSNRVGSIPEHFRTCPDVKRSQHPAVSWAAWGRYARAITQDHRLSSGFGEDSPLARVYDLGGFVLLLGVGHDRGSSLHLAEHKATWPGKHNMKQGAAVQMGHGRQWIQFEDLEHDASDFATIGAAFEQAGKARIGKVACATCRLMSQVELVNFAAEWITANRAR